MGRFSGRFAAAARIAATMLRGTLYERYYDLEYDEVLALPPPQPESGPRSKRGRSGEPAFDAICARTRGEAAPGGRSWSVAGNGLVIERQQLLTTHNLAVLVDRAGVVPQRGWLDLAVQAARLTARLLDLAQRQPRPLSTVKDAAYAWRQSLFFLTMAGGDTTQTGELIERLQELRAGRRWPMTEVLAGLAHVADGSRFDRDGRSPGGRRLLGWTIAPHWALAERESAPIRSA